MKFNRNQIRYMLFKLRNISIESGNLYLEEIEQLENMLEENKYKVVVIGEFSTGKSTFLNALIGEKTLFSSLREATGVVTYIEKGIEQRANIYFENGDKKSLTLNDKQDYKELEKYIDRKSKINKPSYVSISTPKLNIDEEVAFIDTPGLQGIQEKELLITKVALKEANATLVLTNEKGFSGSELDIISGRNTKFGKIRTKDILVIINQIGKVYNGKAKAVGDKKVEGIINEVKHGLQREGLSQIPVFAIDSRDYLWSQDNQLYEETKSSNQDTVTTIYEQDYYLERSRFEDFKKHLMEFLSTDQRNKNFIEDIVEKISYLVEAFEETFTEKEMKEQIEKNKQLDLLENQKILILKNRKKLYNNLVRAISQSVDNYKEKVEEDIKKSSIDYQKKIVQIINKNFPDKKSLNNKNMEKSNRNVSEYIKKERVAVENQLNEYYNTLLKYLIDKTWTEALQNIVKGQTNMKMNIKSAKVKIDLKWKDVKYEEEEKAIQDLLKKQKNIEGKIKKLEKEKDTLESKIYVGNELRLEKKKKSIEAKYLREKVKLGKRPEPIQKERKVEKTRRKFLFIKEKYYEKVPDGLDYTPCKKWDEKQRYMKERYIKEIDKLEGEIAELENHKYELNKIDREIQYKNSIILEIKEEIDEHEKYIKRKKLDQEKYFTNEKKMEIVKKFRKVIKEQYDNIRDQVWNKLYRLEKDVKEELKQEIDKAIKQYEIDLNKKAEDIKGQIQLSNNHLQYINDTLTGIRRDL